jgi:NAD(P)-dependent dehydrogenase (short-subunit alcohol dehydrogenase family)
MAKSTVLITGANKGIGLEYARQYAQAGWQVYACAREPLKASALQALVRDYPQVTVLTLDVSDFNAIQQLAKQLETVKLDLLISNAGVYPDSQLGCVDAQDWLRAFQINTMATYYLLEAFLPHLKRSTQAKVIAMTSKMGSIDDNGSGGEYIYRSSKTALNMLVKSLSIDLRSAGIIVAALHPGWVRTEMGGPNGLIDVQTSVSGLRQVIAQLDLANTGRFIAYDGQSIAW